jgi:UPF0716 protein FxsA
MRWFLLTIIILSAAEIGLFIWIGGLVGPWWVVLIILLTGLAGVTIAKNEGLKTWNRAQLLIRNGEVPTEQITDGICIFIGAVLLIAPGFITDITGFILVLPITRPIFKRSIQKLMKWMMVNRIIIHRR